MKRVITSSLLPATLFVLLAAFSLMNINRSRTMESSAYPERSSNDQLGGVVFELNLGMFSFGVAKRNNPASNHRYLFFSGYRNGTGTAEQLPATGVFVEQTHYEPGDLGRLMVPVTPTSFRVFSIVFALLIGVPLLILIYAFVVAGFKIIFRVAQGNSFNRQNIRGLYLIGWSVLAFGIIPFLVTGLASIILERRIPESIHYDWLANLHRYEGWLLAGLGILVFASAFRKGYQLQQEQKLIV